MELFEELLIGEYTNKKQAQSNPSMWPQINVEIIKKGLHTVEFKSWYKYQGKTNAYRHYRWVYTVLTDNIVTVESENLIDGKPTCPYIFKYHNEDGWWRGTTNGVCQFGNTRVISRTRFNGKEYRSIDSGYHAETKDLLWGKSQREGEFIFLAK